MDAYDRRTEIQHYDGTEMPLLTPEQVLRQRAAPPILITDDETVATGPINQIWLHLRLALRLDLEGVANSEVQVALNRRRTLH